MSIWNKTRTRYESVRYNRCDNKDYEFPQCQECGGSVSPNFTGDAKKGLCPTCKNEVEFVKVPMSQIEAFRSTLIFGQALQTAVAIAYIAPQDDEQPTNGVTGMEYVK